MKQVLPLMSVLMKVQWNRLLTVEKEKHWELLSVQIKPQWEGVLNK